MGITVNPQGVSHGEHSYEFATKSDAVVENSVNLWGFGFDGTACFRKGTKAGPQALREISYGIEGYSPYQDLDLEDFSNIYDLGDLDLSYNEDVDTDFLNATKNLQSTLDQLDLHKNKQRFLLVGGEHSVSYGQIVSHLKQFPNMVLLHLDAHADLRDGYEGHHYSHASIIKRSLDHFGPDHQLIQYGIRSGTKDEYSWMKENGTLATSRAEFLEKVSAIAADRPIYLTLDLDYFDPGIFPGTGTPEPGGEDFHSFISLVKILGEKNFIGADAVELSPSLDSSGNSSVFASKVVRELLLLLAKGIQ